MSLSSPNTLPDLPPLHPEETVPAPPPRDPVWNFWDVMMMVVVALGGMFLFGTLIGLGMTVAGYRLPTSMTPVTLRVILGAQFLSYIVLLFFMHHLVTRQYHRPFREAVRWIAPPGPSWAYYLTGGVVLSFGVGILSRILPVPQALPIDKYFQDASSAWLMTIFGISMAPIVEELFYRGFLYPVLARKLGVPVSAVITSAAFALMHSSQLAHAWGPLLILFLVGMALTITRIVTGSVIPGVLVHIGYNGTLFTILYFATDHFRHLEKVLQ